MESPTVSQRTVRTPLRRYCRSRSRWLKGEGPRTLERPLMGREVVVAITAGKLDFGPWEDAAGDYGPQTLWCYLGEDMASNACAMPGSPIEIVVPLKRPGGKGNHGSQADEA